VNTAISPVAANREVLHIPRRQPSPERLQKAWEIVEQAETGSTGWVFAKEIILLDELVNRAPVVDVEVQAIQIGPAVLLANPAELFCQLGLDIKKASPFPFTFPVELANGYAGYVPTEEAFGKHGGGYETRLTSYSNLVPTAGPQIVEASLRLARTLTPGDQPKGPGPKAGVWEGAWSYGSVPPELN